ncbi:MAG: GYD domain-containing protein [Gammaproteobacteria bacterium]
MGTYILLSTLTPKGRKTLHNNTDRLQQVNKEIEVLGCKAVNQYAVLGLDDFVSIVEAPDNETAVQLSVDLGCRGTVKTLPAMTVDEFRKKLKELAKK